MRISVPLVYCPPVVVPLPPFRLTVKLYFVSSLMDSVNSLLSLPLPLVAVTVKVDVPAAVGVPEIMLFSNPSQSGKLLELHVMLLPSAARGWLYPSPTSP